MSSKYSFDTFIKFIVIYGLLLLFPQIPKIMVYLIERMC